ncbi:hypothetical protein QYH69_29535 [Paraburkholderia sp. SARCC-3016]|uniref:hypothetical protein n=1 Tax=Paraburkholderia sp. SARCC-3016 TaxID=3058611 RepID=UPI0028072803|nr:hypothetical protein [Paraburkholderia sp. SARCC-3016]MDQ7981379.1 hypothetical protein [Paraburkholderia sp. SARCC-3016]
MAVNSAWTTQDLDPRKILLDVRNPRIELGPNASQEEIRLKLLKLEEVLALARSIAKSDGLFQGERIITVIENNKQVVLEGNRRVAACQMLLNPSLIPDEYKGRFPEPSTALKATLREIGADVAPTRQAAEPILTKRHTERGVKAWSPVAKMRRAVRLLERMSVDEVAELLGTTPGAVRKLIRPYRLLKYALDLTVWSEDERTVLEDEKLKTNPYTRFFTLADTQQILRLSFDEQQNPVSELPEAIFRKQMTKIARDFLIPDPVTGRPQCDTRTVPAVYFEEFLKTPAGKKAAKAAGKDGFAGAFNTKSDDQGEPGKKDPAGSKGGTADPKPPRASVFFENLACHVVDDNLIKLTQEIKTINHQRMPIAASLMTRALFECALVYQIKKAKKWGEVLKMAPQNKPGWDPGLGDLIKFAKNFDNGVFTERNICKALASHITDQAKNYLDAMTHIKYQGVDASILESYANHLRGTIKYILEDN